MTSGNGKPKRPARIGVDVGGTFTDVVLALPDGRIHVNKTTTTPIDPGEGVAAGIAALLAEAALDPSEVAEVVHGTAERRTHGSVNDARFSRRARDRTHPHARHVRPGLAQAGATGAAALAS